MRKQEQAESKKGTEHDKVEIITKHVCVWIQMMSLITFQSRAARLFHNAASLVPSCRLFAALSVPRSVTDSPYEIETSPLIHHAARNGSLYVQQFEHNHNNVAKRHKVHKMYQSEKPKSGKDVFLSALRRRPRKKASLCSSIVWPFISGPFV